MVDLRRQKLRYLCSFSRVRVIKGTFMRDSSGFSWCNSPDHAWRPSRREFLFVGVVGTLGLTLGDLFRLQAKEAAIKGDLKEGAAKSIINIYLPGGMAAQE